MKKASFSFNVSRSKEEKNVSVGLTPRTGSNLGFFSYQKTEDRTYEPAGSADPELSSFNPVYQFKKIVILMWGERKVLLNSTAVQLITQREQNAVLQNTDPSPEPRTIPLVLRLFVWTLTEMQE